MLKKLIVLGLVAIIVTLTIKPASSALEVSGSNSIAGSSEQACVCKLLNCECCRSIAVGPVDLNKNMCLNFKLSLFPVMVEVKIKVDNSTVAELKIDATNPPKYCLPIIVPDMMTACLKLHDIKLIGFSGMQVCSTLYVTYQTNEVFGQKLPCAVLSSSGVGIV